MKRSRLTSNESGFAALIIAVVLVIVLSLVTVGFAQLMRREQTAALNRQLSNAAYYAAESGINDGAQAVRSGYTKPKNQCGTGDVDMSMAGHEYLVNQSLDSASNTSYSCLLINPNPGNLQYSRVPTNGVTSAVVTGADVNGNNSNIDTLVFSWQNTGSGQTFTTSGSYKGTAGNSWLPPSVGWKNAGNDITGILRVSITPIPQGSSFDRNYLENNTYTAFLYPEPGAARTLAVVAATPSPYGGHSGLSSGNGELLNGQCNIGNTPKYCAAAINLSSLGQSTYLLHLSSFYHDTQVTITPYLSAAQIYLKGAQIVIDSTGKAQGVLKRIQVRLPAQNSYDYPEFDIVTSNNICKQIASYPQNLAVGTPGNTDASACATSDDVSGL